MASMAYTVRGTKPYRVTRIEPAPGETIRFREIEEYGTKAAAMTAAKVMAGRGARFDAHYGPDSVAYRGGKNGTAVVTW